MPIYLEGTVARSSLARAATAASRYRRAARGWRAWRTAAAASWASVDVREALMAAPCTSAVGVMSALSPGCAPPWLVVTELSRDRRAPFSSRSPPPGAVSLGAGPLHCAPPGLRCEIQQHRDATGTAWGMT